MARNLEKERWEEHERIGRMFDEIERKIAEQDRRQAEEEHIEEKRKVELKEQKEDK